MGQGNLKVTLKLKGVDAFVNENTDMLDRFLDWRPIGNDLHEIMLADHRHMYGGRGRVGEMNNLGPSVINKDHPNHIWEMGRNTFKFGTNVWYSFMYAAKIKEHQNRRTHVQFRAKARRAVNERIALWFTEGK